jgi:hypothetical protein
MPRSNAASTRPWRIGCSRIILGRIVDVYVEDRIADPARPYIKADALHAIDRMNGLGNYVRTRDAFRMIPRIPFEKWKCGKRLTIETGKERRLFCVEAMLRLGEVGGFCLYCRPHKDSRSRSARALVI